MIAFHGNPDEKTAILAQLEAHYKADEIVKGLYWEGGKGCAVGCSIHSSEHAAYEPIFGIPRQLAHLEDTLFENMPNDRAKEWPLQFMRTIKPGSDLTRVHYRFMFRILTDATLTPGIEHELVKDAIKGVAVIMERLANGVKLEEVLEDLAAARSAARSAAWSAARSAESAAWSAAESAESARSAESAARSAARSAAYVRMADILLEELAAA